MFKLNVNGRERTVDVEAEMPLLWVLRDELQLPGTKYGCGVALCGACTVQAWIEHEVPQCGYCQTGMIMAAAALIVKHPKPTDADIDAAMTNLCRCGTYARVRKAIHAVAEGSAAPAVKKA
jgi:isoquinoline 1-oxidoreductase alpha subunit